MNSNLETSAGRSTTNRWFGVLALFVLVAISYVDRINLSVLITDKSFLQQMGMAVGDRASQGFLATAFMAGYGLSAIFFTPFAVALFGVRRGLIYGVTLWGAVTIVTPWFHSYSELLWSRVLLGVSEGPLFSLASYYIKAYFESRENGKPNSWVNMGTGTGLALGFPFVSYMLGGYDWQTSFYALGAINLVLGLPLILLFIYMPSEMERNRKAISVGESLRQVRGMVRGTLETRNLLLLTVMTAAFLAYLWGSSNWLPSYLKEARGFSLREMGWMASLPQYASILAVFIGGFLIDKLGRHRVPLIFVGASICVGLSILIAINVENRYAATVALIAANFFWGLQSPSFPSSVQHFSKPANVASAFGITNGVGSLVAGFMPAIMGIVISSVAAGSGSSTGAGFFAGFALLIGTQFVVLGCALVLWFRERGNVTAGTTASPMTSR